MSSSPQIAIVLDRDSLSDLVQTRGLSQAIRDVAHFRDQATGALGELYRQIVVNGQQPDDRSSRSLIDGLQSIGATSAVLQACRLLTDLRPSDMRSSFFAIIASALISCEQAAHYLATLESGLQELAAVGIGGHGGWNDVCENEVDGSVVYITH